MKKDGTPDANSSVATLAQFGRLKTRAETLLRDMAATLRAGDVAALPARDGDKVDACAYCDYRAVCGHEANDPVREIRRLSADDVWHELEADENSDEKM
jgi:ATP-dependent helicase/nuclease subunit B